MIGPLMNSDVLNAQLVVRAGAGEVRILEEGSRVVLEVPLPLLAGSGEEVLAQGGEVVRRGRFVMLKNEELIAGVATMEAGVASREAARLIYGDLLKELRGRQLYRVWNYLPGINVEVNGLENYRAFNAGRYEAFTECFGPGFHTRLPAASAVGTAGGRLAVAFVAGTGRVRHFENPEQVPAIQYPGEYGGVPPAFARGTVVESGGEAAWYLSGTASIKGHATVGRTIREQAELTCDNVKIMFRRMGLPEEVTAAWKVFLRNPEDLAMVRGIFEESFPGFGEEAMVVRADICRSALLLEVEATLLARIPAALSL